MDPVYALIDVNNFYASCEQFFNPGLRRRPLIVLSNNNGCVITRSNEAKALGIKMGTPLFKIQHLIEAYYQRNNPSILQENFHPTAKQRRHCMKIFLDRIGDAKVAKRK